jgi:hypothetical protein
MKYSNKVNIADFFMETADEFYCIVKLDGTFPNYQAYSDIDIFCYDIKKMVRSALKFGNEYASRGFKIKVNEVSENQVHVDFYAPGEKKLDIRLDFMQYLGGYKKINVKSALFSSILEGRVPIKQNGIDLFVPSPIDDLLIRYIEFVEYYDIRADKIKHAEYINNLASKLDKNLMFDKLHFYTELPLSVSKSDEVNANFNASKSKNSHAKSHFSFKRLRRKIIQVRLKKNQKYIKVFGFLLFESDTQLG